RRDVVRVAVNVRVTRRHERRGRHPAGEPEGGHGRPVVPVTRVPAVVIVVPRPAPVPGRPVAVPGLVPVAGPACVPGAIQVHVGPLVVLVELVGVDVIEVVLHHAVAEVQARPVDDVVASIADPADAATDGAANRAADAGADAGADSRPIADAPNASDTTNATGAVVDAGSIADTANTAGPVVDTRTIPNATDASDT